MPKTTQELANSRAGETAESNGFGAQERPLRPAGLYQLKNDDGVVVDELIVKVHPKFGDGQAAAAERVGYKFVRPVKPGEVKEIEVDAQHLATENDRGQTNETLKGVQARLTALEKENAELRASQSAENNRGAADDGDESDEDDEDKGGEKPFKQLNRAELETLAEKEQITLPAEADTNAKIREVITKARAEKEGK